MERITLPSGMWIDVRDEPNAGGRRAVQAITMGLGKEAIDKLSNADPKSPVADLGFTEEQFDGFLRLQEATILAFVAGWSRPEPVTKAALTDLPISLYDEIAAATAPKGAQTAAATLDLSPGLDGPDPKDFSGNSENLSGHSEAAAG